MLRSITTMVKVHCERKTYLFIYVCMLTIVGINFYSSIKENRGISVYQMNNPISFLFLSILKEYGYYFLQNIPLVFAFPAAFGFFNDISCREIIYLQSRLGKRKYIYSRLISNYIATFIVFAVPMMLELLLTYIIYPKNIFGDGINSWDFEAYDFRVRQYMFYNVWKINKYLYAMLMIILVASFIAIIAMFAESISFVCDFRYKLMLIMPIYFLLSIVSYFRVLFKLKHSTNYFDYMQMLMNYENFRIIFLFMAVIVAVTLVLAEIKIRKDEVI